MPSDPKANPDVLHVDETTRDAITTFIRATAKAAWNAATGPLNEMADLIESRFPVSAERQAHWPDDYHPRPPASEALAADQSQSDRTSDEATPAEPG